MEIASLFLRKMAAWKWAVGKVERGDCVGLPMGPVFFRACSVAEECLHFLVSSAKSLPGPGLSSTWR